MRGRVGLYRCHVVAIWGASWAILERVNKCGKCHMDWVLRAIKCGFYHTDWSYKAIKCVFYYTDWGVLWTGKAKTPWGPSAFGNGFGALGGRGANSQLANRTLRLRICGYMAK
jgi:hypothetical protein